MKWLTSLIVIGSLLTTAASSQAAEPDSRPNVLLIMADDLGYSDLGCYGGEIQTPHLDSLAQNGLRFTSFYNTARCWPTRAALLTGYYAQQVRRDAIPNVPSGGGNRGIRPAWARLLPEMLRPVGYRSYHSGKWHIDGEAMKNGFDHSYDMRDQGRFFSPQSLNEDGKEVGPISPDSGYYATTAIAEHSIKCLKEHASLYADKPFFQYLAFTAPHFPLHALTEDIARYKGRYSAGWEKVRQERWSRMNSLELAAEAPSEVELEIGPPYDFPEHLRILGPNEVNRPLPWDSLTEDQKYFQEAKMEIHAAMVDRMDLEIGRVLDQIKSMGVYDNTLIFFLSDNGASAEIMVRHDGHDPQASPGSAASHLCLGPGWSTVSNTPFRRHKTWVHEGGIATPLIVHWPKGILAKGELRHNPGHVIDIVPTILDVAGAKRFETWENKPVPAAPGKSLVPAFQTDGTVKREALWWCHEENKALRQGNYKLVAAKGTPWELYDLSTDRAETKNLATQQPERVKAMEEVWNRIWQQCVDMASQETAATTPNAPAKPVKELILPGQTFLIKDRPAFIMLPPAAKRSTPQPWIMYAPTLPAYPDQHEKWMHEQFLAAGVAVAGIDVGEAYGSPKAFEYFDSLHRQLTRRRGFAERPCLLGRSRGGLWASSWGAANPEKISGLAGIYPVFDITTYPGLQKAAPAYGLSPEELKAQLGTLNPISQVKNLAAAKVPVFIIHGDDDKVVPLKENSATLKQIYVDQGAGDAVELLVIPGQGHNFWEGFFRCQELVDFAVARARSGI